MKLLNEVVKELFIDHLSLYDCILDKQQHLPLRFIYMSVQLHELIVVALVGSLEFLVKTQWK